MYGFTEITPGRIRVNKIISNDGNTYFDLAKSEIGGKIDFKDGLVSGDIGVADNDNQINAGMSGQGSNPDAVRFWAGATTAQKHLAPFRVQHNGHVVLKDVEIFGFIKSKQTIINKTNYMNYLIQEYGDEYKLDFNKINSDVVFDSSLNTVFNQTIIAHLVMAMDIGNREYRSMIGQRIVLENNSVDIGVTGHILLSETSISPQSFMQKTGTTCILRSKPFNDSFENKVSIAWIREAYYNTQTLIPLN